MFRMNTQWQWSSQSITLNQFKPLISMSLWLATLKPFRRKNNCTNTCVFFQGNCSTMGLSSDILRERRLWFLVHRECFASHVTCEVESVPLSFSHVVGLTNHNCGIAALVRPLVTSRLRPLPFGPCPGSFVVWLTVLIMVIQRCKYTFRLRNTVLIHYG